MNDNELLSYLTSGEFDRINRALVHLGSASAKKPAEKVAMKLIELCSDRDPDIRNEAIYAAGFRWKMRALLPLLVAIVCDSSEDDLILNSAVYAVGEILRAYSDLRQQGLKTLSHVALDESMPQNVRANAYALIAWNEGRISLDQFAKMGTPGSDVVIDRDWLMSLPTEAKRGHPGLI